MADILQANRKAIIRKREELGIPSQVDCNCNWGIDCARYQLIYWQQGDPLFGAPPIRLHRGGTAQFKPKNVCWKHVVEKSLPLNSKSNKPRISIARHHWTRKQLENIAERKAKISTGVSIEVARATAHSFDPTARWYNDFTGQLEYFHAPNVPKKVVEDDVRSLISPRMVRIKEREEQLRLQKELEAQRAAEEKERQEKQVFEALSFQDYRQEKKAQLDLIASLQNQVATLTSERDNLASQQVQLTSERDSWKEKHIILDYEHGKLERRHRAYVEARQNAARKRKRSKK